MNTIPPFTLTNESITVVWEGKPHVVQKGSPNFPLLRKAIVDENWDDIQNHLTISKSLKEWAQGKFTIEGGVFLFEGEPLPSDINQRILLMASKGEDPTPVTNFWEHLKKNPSWRSVQQLWPFLKHKGIPLTPDGCFLAYKSVKDNYKDVHSGQFDNKPGTINKMERNQISDDPKEACHEGFHVGALRYAQGFGGSRIVVCKVDPENVVCVPYDSSQEKMRVCKYEVIGNHNGDYLPSTTFTEDKYEDDKQEGRESDKKDDPLEEEEDSLSVEEGGADEDEVDDTEDSADEDDDEEVFCDECGNSIPENGEPSIVNSFHKPSCSLYEEEEPQKRKPKKGFAKLDKLDMNGLLERSIEELRKYATKGLQITGASKIPGGKVALVGRILEVRE